MTDIGSQDQGRAIVAIQARLGSTRLPRKVMADVCGAPMIDRLTQRMQRAASIDAVLVATTSAPEDAELAEHCHRHQVPVYRGSVDDIAERLLGAAEALDADIVVRAWGDSPLLDPVIVDRAVDKLRREQLDCVTTFFPRRSYPAGFDVDVYRVETLRRLKAETADPFFREYPFEYAAQSALRTALLSHEPNLAHLELTVDYAEDLERIRAIFAELGPEAVFGIEAVVALVERRPDLRDRSGQPRNIEYRRDLQARAAGNGAEGDGSHD